MRRSSGCHNRVSGVEKRLDDAARRTSSVAVIRPTTVSNHSPNVRYTGTLRRRRLRSFQGFLTTSGQRPPRAGTNIGFRKTATFCGTRGPIHTQRFWKSCSCHRWNFTKHCRIQTSAFEGALIVGTFSLFQGIVVVINCRKRQKLRITRDT